MSLPVDITDRPAELPPVPTGEGPLSELVGCLTDAGAAESCRLTAAAAVAVVRAELGAVIRATDEIQWAGAPASPELAAELASAAERGLAHASLPGLGAADLAAVALDADTPGWLVVARRHRARFEAGQERQLATMARVLSLNLRVARATEEELGQRRRGEQEMRQRKRAERELAHRALHDPLTGLANRSLIRERTVHALERGRHGVGFVAVLFVDIDHFKLTNDSLDHRRGDKLLVVIGQRLCTILTLEENDRRNCTLARPGGDEFIVLCEDLESEHDAITIAQQIQDALRAPFFIDGQQVTLTASIGVVCTAGAGGEAIDADALLRDADVALSRAKERGRDRYEIFDEPMRARLLDRVELESDLREALEQDELRLLYQPVVTASDGSLAAVEALIRWQHPRRGLLGPGEFIPVAEESELIVSVGAWVIEEACAQLRRWREGHAARLGVRVSVNVSARQLSPALVETVAGALEENGVSSSQLALEITETLLIEHTESAREVLAALEELGVTIVLDDFGTGYSSLGYLNEFPLGQLKLDRSFTAELARDPRSAKIVAATIDMARALGMTVVAEGVETEEQVEVLQRLGCDYAQGFFFARPEAPEATFERIREAYEHDREIASPPGEGPRFSAAAHRTSPNSLEEAQRRHQAAIGRLAGWMFLAGSMIALPSDLVMGSPGALAILLITVMAVLSGLVCLAIPWTRVPGWWLNVVAVVATVETTVSVLAAGRHGTVLQPVYLLIATATAYAFRDRRVIAAHIALIAAAMTVPLGYQTDTAVAALPLTMVAILVLFVMSAVIAYLRELLEGSAAELRDLAGRDPLTGVGNYRLLHERLEYELTRHQRDGEDFALLLIDLDRFKLVNERRGHAAGDDVLRRVGVTLLEAVRTQDTVARQGGDEFAVLAPNTDAEGAAMLASRIRERLGRIQFAGDTIGATIGWAVFPVHGKTPNELLAHADEALMTGKLRPHQGLGAAERVRRAPTALLEGS